MRRPVSPYLVRSAVSAFISSSCWLTYPVDKAVGSPKNDRPELIEPLDSAPQA